MDRPPLAANLGGRPRSGEETRASPADPLAAEPVRSLGHRRGRAHPSHRLPQDPRWGALQGLPAVSRGITGATPALDGFVFEPLVELHAVGVSCSSMATTTLACRSLSL